jgi:outer membrane protein OmpA-like peptidoglycan-associated protein
MSSQSDDSQGVVVVVLIGAVLLAMAMVFGAVNFQKGKQHAAAAAAAAAPVQATSPVTDADGASVTVENGVVKFYFASGKADLATGANDALAAVVTGVAGGKKALVSGFHDATGDAAKNEELSKQRAFAVRDALVQLGVAQDRIELKKPEETAVAGPAAQARRVEVTLE